MKRRVRIVPLWLTALALAPLASVIPAGAVASAVAPITPGGGSGRPGPQLAAT
jgi:hypothetical protein